MKHLFLFFLVYLAAVMQSVLHDRSGFVGVPLLLLPLTFLFVSRTLDGWSILFWASIFGLFDDALSGAILGPAMAVFIVWGYYLSRRESPSQNRSVLRFLLTTFLMLFLWSVTVNSLRLVSMQEALPIHRFVSASLFASGWTTGLGMVLMGFVQIVTRFLPQLRTQPSTHSNNAWKMLSEL